VPKACDLKKGDVVDYKGAPHLVKHIDVKSPSSRSATTLYKVRMNHVTSGQKVDASFKGDDMLGNVDFERRKVLYSFRDGEAYVFMDEEDFSQHSLAEDELGDDRFYVFEGMESVVGLLVNGRLITIELPQSMVMTVVETSPVIKGASASARTKPASFATGLVIQVPEYLDVGEQVKINTEENRYISRA
jgi:elongation factor P